jgi:uncharacterized protein (TIGR00255 family)
MLRSMTGFGAARATIEGEELSIEIRSLNHKFCEVKARLPRELSSLEPQLGKSIKDRLARGAVEVLVKRQSAAAEGNVPVVDLSLAREYHRAFSEISAAVGISGEVSVVDLAAQPGVIRLEERTVDVASATKALEQGLVQALDALVSMRAVEGEAIKHDLLTRLGLIEKLTHEVAKFAPRAVDEYRARLVERIAELAKGVAVDPQRLAQEVAFFAERSDVAEELTRLASHVQQFRALVDSGEPSGRKMDFLVQEMHREVNTTGSKSQHPEISARVVILKAELERLREQVQNVE